MNSAYAEIKTAMAEVPERLEAHKKREEVRVRAEVDRFLENLPKVIRDAADRGATSVPVLTNVTNLSQFHVLAEEELKKMGLVVDWTRSGGELDGKRRMALMLRLA